MRWNFSFIVSKTFPSLVFIHPCWEPWMLFILRPLSGNIWWWVVSHLKGNIIIIAGLFVVEGINDFVLVIVFTSHLEIGNIIVVASLLIVEGIKDFMLVIVLASQLKIVNIIVRARLFVVKGIQDFVFMTVLTSQLKIGDIIVVARLFVAESIQNFVLCVVCEFSFNGKLNLVGPDFRIFHVVVFSWFVIRGAIQNSVLGVMFVGEFSFNFELYVIRPDLRVRDVIRIFLGLDKGILDLVLSMFSLAYIAIL